MQPGDASRSREGGPRNAHDARGGRRDAHDARDAGMEALRRALARAVKRVERRAEAVEGDVAKADAAAAAADRARGFVAAAAEAPRGTKRLVAQDWSTGEARTIEMPLDPARSAKEQLDGLFQRARRMKAGRATAQARLEQARATLEALRAIAAELEANAEADLGALEARAKAAAPRDFKGPPAAGAAPRRRALQAPAPSYRLFTSVDGAPILVGRGAAHNDGLTLHVARPRDLWLHARGCPGAHVVVRLAKGRDFTSESLVDAAHLAAHFSDARDEQVVEVTYVPRRYVRKPRGSAPGAVVVDREKVIVLRRDEAVLRRLLDSERPADGERV